ncbi:MAG: hypothetical protein CL793_04600 [Chloroflexi bacterium]|nr:hypothetical protein [Chloroflexota bacterium]|tara:strand:- start:638 stop:901 length:264 start_codon:yes stop_codon:yes gene_type:complete
MHIGYVVRIIIGTGILIALLGASDGTEIATTNQSPEANLPFLFAAFAVAWLGFIIYAWYLASQHSRLRQEIANMQKQLTDIQDSIEN